MIHPFSRWDISLGTPSTYYWDTSYSISHGIKIIQYGHHIKGTPHRRDTLYMCASSQTPHNTLLPTHFFNTLLPTHFLRIKSTPFCLLTSYVYFWHSPVPSYVHFSRSLFNSYIFTIYHLTPRSRSFDENCLFLTTCYLSLSMYQLVPASYPPHTSCPIISPSVPTLHCDSSSVIILISDHIWSWKSSLLSGGPLSYSNWLFSQMKWAVPNLSER